MSKVGFQPNGTYVLIQVPQSYYDKIGKEATILNKADKASRRKEYIEGGGDMEVMAVGEGRFARVGDMVSINSRGSFELTIDGEVEPFIMIRESEILGKFI